MEFQYVIDANSDEPIMLILNHIGYDSDMGQGVDGTDFLKELLLLDTMGKSRIQIWINSVGGSVIDGWSILGGMLKTKTKVDTYNIGVAASTAGWLFEAGRTRVMSDYALWMGHNPSGGNGGEILDRMRKSIITTISGRTGMTEEEVGAMLDKETYMDAEECKAANFCDEIQKTSSLNIKRVSQAATVKDKWHEAQLILNTFLPTKQKPTIMSDTKISASITNKLSLHEAASDVMVVEAIEAVQNKLTVSETNLTVATNKIAAKEKEMEELRTKCDNLQKECDQYKSLMEEAEYENRLAEAKNMVAGFATQGKITNEAAVIDQWVSMAIVGSNAEAQKASFDMVKNALTGLPVNKVAEKITVISGTTTAPVANSMALTMARIAKEKGQRK